MNENIRSLVLAVVVFSATIMPVSAQQSSREIYERNADILGIPADQRHPPPDDSAPPTTSGDAQLTRENPPGNEQQPFTPAGAGQEATEYGERLPPKKPADAPDFAPPGTDMQPAIVEPDFGSPGFVSINSYVEYPMLPLLPGGMTTLSPIGTGGFLPAYPGLLGTSMYPGLGTGGWNWVNGHVRSDGTYAPPHWRQGPVYPTPALPRWNWPLNQSGPSGYTLGRTQQVGGYGTANGTFVNSYMRRTRSR